MQADGFNKSIPSINNLRAYYRSVFKGLQVIFKNLFLCGENEWYFNFGNPVVLYMRLNSNEYNMNVQLCVIPIKHIKTATEGGIERPTCSHPQSFSI